MLRLVVLDRTCVPAAPYWSFLNTGSSPCRLIMAGIVRPVAALRTVPGERVSLLEISTEKLRPKVSSGRASSRGAKRLVVNVFFKGLSFEGQSMDAAGLAWRLSVWRLEGVQGGSISFSREPHSATQGQAETRFALKGSPVTAREGRTCHRSSHYPWQCI